MILENCSKTSSAIFRMGVKVVLLHSPAPGPVSESLRSHQELASADACAHKWNDCGIQAGELSTLADQCN